jgi:hypothetical protein
LGRVIAGTGCVQVGADGSVNSHLGKGQGGDVEVEAGRGLPYIMSEEGGNAGHRGLSGWRWGTILVQVLFVQ